jgi:hypothetical protein
MTIGGKDIYGPCTTTSLWTKCDSFPYICYLFSTDTARSVSPGVRQNMRTVGESKIEQVGSSSVAPAWSEPVKRTGGFDNHRVGKDLAGLAVPSALSRFPLYGHLIPPPP